MKKRPAAAAAAGGARASAGGVKKRPAAASADTEGPEAKRAASEPSHADAKALVWSAINGAMQATQLYIGDKMGLYSALRELCSGPGRSATACDLASRCSLSARWVREWCAQQAAMGVLVLLDGEGSDDADMHYRLPDAFADVLADPLSTQYDISLIQMVPTLVGRAKSDLPRAFITGVGTPYNDRDISMAIDRHHAVQIRDTVLPRVIPAAADGGVLASLQRGIRVADLGCGGGNLLFALAARFPDSQFHGYDVSPQALEVAAAELERRPSVRNVSFHDARSAPLGEAAEPFDLVTTIDVLHDATDPEALARQVKKSLAPGGVWLLADMVAHDDLRSNVRRHPGAATMLAFSTCLCMASALSEPGGAGLGTLGFTVPVARDMLGRAGFTRINVLLEEANTRWFEVMP